MNSVRFERCVPSNGWRYVLALVLAIGLLVWIAIMARRRISLPPQPGETHHTAWGFLGVLAAADLYAILILVRGFLSPQECRIRLSDVTLTWQSPTWSNSHRHEVQLASIRCVTAWTGGEGDHLAIRSLGGDVIRIPRVVFSICCHGSAALLLKSLRETAPQLLIEERADSFLDWRGPA